MAKQSKYLRIVAWARARYTDSKGVLVISQGRLIDGKAGQVLTAYGRIESAAWNKYMKPVRDAQGRILFGA